MALLDTINVNGQWYYIYFSPNDKQEVGKGYYIQRLKDFNVSQLFKTPQEAAFALRRNEIKWEE